MSVHNGINGINWQPSNHDNQFSRDASIILVGSRGVGKSSLAVLTAMALNRRFVDLIVTIETLCGESCEAIRAKYGHDVFCKKEAELLASILKKYPKNCVIATSSSTVEEPGRSVLMKYKTSMPIINIVRSTEDVNHYLSRYDDYEELVKLASARADLYKLCSDFEFMNNGTRYLNDTNDSSLGVKNAEREFLRFLERIYEPVHTHQPSVYIHDLLLPYHDVTKLADLQAVSVGADTLHIQVDQMALYAMWKGIDMFTYISTQIGFIRRRMRLPIVYAFGRQQYEELHTMYPMLVLHGLKSNVDYMLISSDLLVQSSINRVTRSKRNTRIIGCFTLNTWDVDRVQKYVEQGLEMGCDLVRLNSFALELDDNFALITTIQQLKAKGIDISKLIMYNNGPLGKISRCLNHLLTPVSHATFWKDPNSFFGIQPQLPEPEFQGPDDAHLTVKEANEMLNKLHITPTRSLYCIGDGPGYWKDLLQDSIGSMGLPFAFEDAPIIERKLFSKVISEQRFGGAFVCEPFKGDILYEAPTCSNDARMIGAANLVVAMRCSQTLRNNLIRAENTDWMGIYQVMLRKLPTRNSITTSTSAVVVGTEGLGRAAVFALINLGVMNIYVHDHSQKNQARDVITQFQNTADNVKMFGAQASNIDQANDTIFSMRYITRKGNLSQPDRHRPKTYGTISFEGDNRGSVFGCLDSLDCGWPESTSPPTIIINSTSSDIELHPSWYGNVAGGIVVDLNRTGSHRLQRQLDQLRANESPWVDIPASDVWIEIADASLELLTGKKTSCIC